MARGAPRRPQGPKRPRRSPPGAQPRPPRLERSYAQKVRADRQGAGPSWESRAKRAAFWAGVQAAQAADQQDALNYVSSSPPVGETPLATANIRQATIESAAPVPPGYTISVPGMDQTGLVPPPPTGAV